MSSDLRLFPSTPEGLAQFEQMMMAPFNEKPSWK